MVFDSCYYAAVLAEPDQQELIGLIAQKIDSQNIIELNTKPVCGILKNAYKSPERLGVDRWLAMLGAVGIGRDVIIVDAGSALTIDLLKKNGRHLGGAILPGYNTSLERFKRILHKVDFNHADINKNHEPGCSTETCIHIDYHPTDDSVINELVNRWRPLLDKNVILIATGGDANRVAGQALIPCRVRPDLVFQGMLQQLKSEKITE